MKQDDFTKNFNRAVLYMDTGEAVAAEPPINDELVHVQRMPGSPSFFHNDMFYSKGTESVKTVGTCEGPSGKCALVFREGDADVFPYITPSTQAGPL